MFQIFKSQTPTQTHRVLTLVSVVSLFIGLRTDWTAAIADQLPLGLVLTFGYGVLLTCAALAMCVRRIGTLLALDTLILLTGLTFLGGSWVMHHAPNDEGSLTAYAAQQLLGGHLVYDQNWAHLFTSGKIVLTKTMDGGGNITYGYPPLALLLTAFVFTHHASAVAATFVTVVALALATIGGWLLVPLRWKPVVTMTCLGFGLLTGAASAGYPAILALMFSVPVVAYWHRTGFEGKLGVFGVLQALALGAAWSSQQLAWFYTPFLLVGIFAVRRPALGVRRTLLLLTRYVALALAVFLAVNAYFIWQDPRAWLNGMTVLISQHAILHGQGLMGLSYYFTPGSRHLVFYSYASILLLVGLLGITVLFVRKIGPALFILPYLSFYLAMRSQEGYYTLMMPLWFIAAATVPYTALRHAWQPRFINHLRPNWRKVIAGLLLLPALGCVVIAAASTPPLRLHLDGLSITASRLSINQITVDVQNKDDVPITPHFAYREGEGASAYFTVKRGPQTLAPGTTATYVLIPSAKSGLQHIAQDRAKGMNLIVVSDDPLTITTLKLPRPALAVKA